MPASCCVDFRSVFLSFYVSRCIQLINVLDFALKKGKFRIWGLCGTKKVELIKSTRIEEVTQILFLLLDVPQFDLLQFFVEGFIVALLDIIWVINWCPLLHHLLLLSEN